MRETGWIVCAAFLGLVSTGAHSAEKASAPVVERVGVIEVLTPPCGASECRAIYTTDKVRKWLIGFVGERFNHARVERKLIRRYEALGYRPRVEVALEEGSLRVSILEAPAAVGSVAVDPDRAAAILAPGLMDGLPPVERPHVLMHAVRTHPGDLVNGERLAQDRYDLSLLGYDIVAVEESSVAPPTGPAGTDPTVPATKTADAPRDYVIARRPPRGRWKEAKATSPDERETRLPIGALQKRWISGSAEYSRRELFSARLFYQRSHLFREFDMVEISPYVSQQIAGAVTYQIPYLLPATITKWNLFGEVKVYDEFTPDRLLGGTELNGKRVGAVEVDEQRTGGRLSLGLEPFRHWNGHSLRGTAYINRYHASFTECAISVNCDDVAAGTARVPGSRVNDVNIVGVTFDYGFAHLFRAPRLSWRFLPTAEVATKARGGDLAFRRVFGELQQHYVLGAGFEIDARWKAGIVDRRVPVYEQFTLGGADSIRGFLRDDFIGRRFASAQHDVWIPIPFRAFGRDSRILGALERNLKTAITLDGGSVSFDDAVKVRVARGIGAGLRYQAEGSPLVVRLDAAYGYYRGTSQWYPYLSFTRKW